MKKNIYLYIMVGFFAFGAVGCYDAIPDFFNQYNQGFLAYGSGFGISDGVKARSFSDGYFLLGNTDNGFDRNYFLLRTTPEGLIDWSISYGDLGVDNEAVDILIQEDKNKVYLLGNQYDDIYERVTPYITTFSLDGEFGDSFDEYQYLIRNDTLLGAIYEEKAKGLIRFPDQEKIIMTTTPLFTDGFTETVVYLIDETGDSIQYFNRTFLTAADIPDANIAQSLSGILTMDISAPKKVDDNSFLTASTLTQLENPNETIFYFVKYSLLPGVDTLAIDGEWFYSVPYEAKIEDFEILKFDGDNANIKIMLLNAESKSLFGDILLLPPTQGQVVIDGFDGFITFLTEEAYMVEESDTISFGFKKDKDATISKLAEADGSYSLFVTAVKDNNGIYVERLNLASDGSITRPMTENPTDVIGQGGSSDASERLAIESRGFNNLTNFDGDKNRQIRNNIGNVVKHGGGDNQYAIIGTHDFLDVTKMILMQIDKDGNYIEREE